MAETEVKAVDYSTMTKDQLFELLGQAFAAKDFKQMGKLSVAVAKAEAAEEKAKKDALQAELAGKTTMVEDILDTIVGFLTGGQAVTKDMLRNLTSKLQNIKGTELDGADGVWYAKDFGEKVTQCRLTKSAPRKATGEGGTSSGKSSYVSSPVKSEDALQAVGEHIMFDKDTSVTIDKVEQVMVAGTTFRQAYEFSTNGGWRNRVRMALLKEGGYIG